jgi:hypothetical protein
MKSPGKERSVLIQKISWITVGVVGFGVFVGAVLLAIDAPPGDPPEAVASKPIRAKRSARKSRHIEPKAMRAESKLPKVPVVKGTRPPTTPGGDEKVRGRRPDLLHGKMKGIHKLKSAGRGMRSALATRNRAGRLSKDELQTRREERRKRQVERLGKRIQTLEDRIQNYKQDGTRTEAQISRMERSLERMRKRLKRMQDQQDR